MLAPSLTRLKFVNSTGLLFSSEFWNSHHSSWTNPIPIQSTHSSIPALILVSCSPVFKQALQEMPAFSCQDLVLVFPDVSLDLIHLFSLFLRGQLVKVINLEQLEEIKLLCEVLKIQCQFDVKIHSKDDFGVEKLMVKDNVQQAENLEKDESGKKNKTWFVCKYCPKWFQQRRHLLEHQKFHESDALKCRFCPKSFARPSLRKYHEKLHLHPFQCEVCDKSFGRLSSLKEHRNTHKPDKPHSCDDCGKSFSTSSGLGLHKKQNHSLKPLPFLCQICDKRFISESLLIRHKQGHGKVRPFVCKRCGRGFKTQKTLLCHSRVHQDDSEFPCQICPKTYRWKAALVRHGKEHTNDKLVKCPDCEFFFKTKKLMSAHRSWKHKTEES